MLINLTKKGVFLCRQKKKSYFCSVINLSRHIEYQLLYHDTVVVPQLGTFKATYVPSKWIKDEEILLPPYRALSFTQETDESDNRFVESISATYQISTEEAYIVTLEYTENIRQELAETEAAGEPVCVLDAPLLFEAGLEALCDTVWCAWLPKKLQLKRLMERDGLTRKEAEMRIASQMPPREKKKRSDLVIDTRGTREESAAFAEQAYRELLSCIEENQTSLEEHC